MLHLKVKLFYFMPVLGMSYNKQIPTTFLTLGQVEALHMNCRHTHIHTVKKISQEDQSAGHCKEITTRQHSLKSTVQVTRHPVAKYLK